MRLKRPVLLLSLVIIAGCGTRSVAHLDGGQLDQWSRTAPETGPAAERGIADGRVPGPDACVWPPGACLNRADCPTGNECVGCGPDPCCPTCDECVGHCTPVAGCTSNAQCQPTELCLLTACGTLLDPPGACQPRPSACPAVYSPVCGCDDKTYGNDCEAHAAGVSVKSPGSCCAELTQQYATALAAAKTCCALCATPIIPCQQLVDSQLSCGCPTSVNMSAPELSTLKSLAAQWQAQGCGATIDCAAVPCPKVTGSSCQPASGTAGQCTDIY
jgi:hypothetical protein